MPQLHYIEFRNVKVCTDTGAMWVNGKAVTRQCSKLGQIVKLLARNHGQPIHPITLAETLGLDPRTSALRQLVSRLRHELGDTEPWRIVKCHKKKGYWLSTHDEAADPETEMMRG